MPDSVLTSPFDKQFQFKHILTGESLGFFVALLMTAFAKDPLKIH